MPRPRRDVPWPGKRGEVHYAFWYDEDARTTRGLSLRTRDPVAAQARFAAFLAEAGAITGHKPKTDLTVAEVLAFYERDHLQAGQVIDRKRGENAIKRLTEFFGDYPISAVDIPLSRDYAVARAAGAVTGNGRAAKPATVRRELGVLAAAATHCVKWKRITAEQMPTIEKPSAPDTKGLYLTRDELAAIRGAAETNGRWFIDLAYYTGSRREAIQSLTWAQVDMERNRIRLKPSGERVSNKRRPVVPIDPALKPTLEELKGRHGDHVLPQPFHSWWWLEKAAKRAKLFELPETDGRPAGTVSPHILRHSRATHLLQDGVSPWAVANLLGDTVETVLKVYGHHCPDYLDEVFKRRADADAAVAEQVEAAIAEVVPAAVEETADFLA